jgi:hypothetical protein
VNESELKSILTPPGTDESERIKQSQKFIFTVLIVYGSQSISTPHTVVRGNVAKQLRSTSVPHKESIYGVSPVHPLR